MQSGNEKKKQGYAEIKLQPSDVEIEKAVLGAILIHSVIFSEVHEILKTPDCFYDQFNQTIYTVILEMFAKGSAIDALTVVSELNRAHATPNMNWTLYCFDLSNAVLSTAHTQAHCLILMEKYMAREMITLGHTLVAEGYKQENDAFDVVEMANKGLSDLTEKNVSKVGKSAAELAVILKDSVTKLQQPNAMAGIRSGFPELDAITNGWGKEWLVILAARPAVGKSAFAINLMMNAALNKVPVAFFSLEMSLNQVTSRCIAALGEIDLWKITQPRAMRNELDMQDFERFTSEFSNLPIHIDDTAAITPIELRAKARRLKQKHDVQLIIVDYLQLMQAGIKTQNREAEISHISRNLKRIAKELQVPIIALAQLSRGVESRQNKVPMLSDLRESGSIEQDADMVMFLYRPEYHGIKQDENGDIEEGKTEVHVAKNRHGSAQVSVTLIFDKDIQKFRSVEDTMFDDQPIPDNPRAGITPNYAQHFQQNTLPYDDNF